MSKKRSGEAKFTTDLQKWMKHNWKKNGPIEVKVSYEKSFNYLSGFKSHQLTNLINARTSEYCQTYKISDYDRLCKPYDVVAYYKCESYVIIHWVRKGNKTFYIIDPRVIQFDIDTGIKSLNEGRARDISAFTCELGTIGC